MIRCFIAVAPSAPVRQVLWAHTQAQWGGCPGLRLIPDALLHLTVRFLGDVSPEAAAAIGDTLESELCGSGPGHCALEGYGVFPKPTSPRVLWVGMTDCRGGHLEGWRRAADRAARVAGCPDDRKAFIPHITVGRFREGSEGRVVQRYLEAVPAVEADAFTVNAVSLGQ